MKHSPVRTVRLFGNDTMKAIRAKEELIQKLKEKEFMITDADDYDLGISIGGDGAFLRMGKETNFPNDKLFVGLAAGTLAFSSEVEVEDLDSFLEDLKKGTYQVELVALQKTTIKMKHKSETCYSLNEIVVREKDLNTIHLEVWIDKHKLENFQGDGILLSSSFGSTAYNLSFGGAIVPGSFHTLQLTPIAPLNSKVYRTLRNSIILPSRTKIELIPRKGNGIIITRDGENKTYEDVQKITTTLSKKGIHLVRRNEYHFIEKIQDKFLS